MVFKGNLKQVLIASSTDLGEALYGETAGAAASYRAQSRNPNNPNVYLFSDFYAALAAALTTDAERLLAASRCIYIVEPDDKDIMASIKDNILVSNAASDFVVDFFQEDEFGQMPPMEVARLKHTATKSVTQALSENLGDISSSDNLALTKICNAELRIGDPVVMIYFTNGGTPKSDQNVDVLAPVAEVDTPTYDDF